MRIDVTRLTYANAHPYYRSYFNAKSIPFQIPLYHICINIGKTSGIPPTASTATAATLLLLLLIAVLYHRP